MLLGVTVSCLAKGASRILTESNRRLHRGWRGSGLLVILQVILLAWIVSIPARAEGSLLSSRAYWVDPSGVATLVDAMAAPFQPYTDIISEGYTRSSLWLRLEIAGQSSVEPIALIVQPPFLEHIELYQPNGVEARSVSPLVSGRDIVPNEVNHVGISSGFVLGASATPRTLYLRISSSTALTADVAVMSLNDAMNANRRFEGFLAVYVALLAGICLWGLVSWMVRREAIYGFFVLRQAYSLLFLFALFGLLRFYVFPDVVSIEVRGVVYVFIVVTVIITIGYFDLRLLSAFGASTWVSKVLGGALFLPLISVVLLLLGQQGAALRFNASIINIVILLTCLLAFSVKDPERDRFGSSAVWTIRIGFVVTTLIICIPILMYLNLVPTKMPAIYLIVSQSLISATIMVSLLTIRSRRRDFAAQQALLDIQIKERELREESQRRSEKERFLSMLTHELRNPLGVIRLVTDTTSPTGKTIEKAALDMTGVIERVEQSEKLESQPPSPDPSYIGLGTFLDELAQNIPFRQRLRVHCDVGLSILTDGPILRFILRNLLDNAIKYSPAETPIMLVASSTSSDGEAGVKIEVINRTGEAGAPDPAKLYTKYYRNKRAHHQPGSGLGLFLVSSWVRALGGTIDYQLLQNDDGSQSVSFELLLPS